MRIIGVTGGIGSGKSTVAHILESFGAKVIDADIVARSIVEKGQKALEEIKAYFGNDVINSTGDLDRKKLGNIVFRDTDKLSVLNDITHKYIIQKIKKMVAEAGNKGVETVIIDAAIPFKSGFLDTVDEVWVVIADEKVRIERVMKRNDLTFNEAANRINSQMSQEDYEKLAHRIISNNGGKEELKNIVEGLFFN